jgi:hypothetical protein
MPAKRRQPTLEQYMSKSISTWRLAAGDDPEEESESRPGPSETSPGGSREGRWQTVARTAGLLPAQIIGGRLEAEGIPVRVWQEGAGRALGLTVGMLGAGHVMVPESYAEQARQILAESEVGEWDEEE